MRQINGDASVWQLGSLARVGAKCGGIELRVDLQSAITELDQFRPAYSSTPVFPPVRVDLVRFGLIFGLSLLMPGLARLPMTFQYLPTALPRPSKSPRALRTSHCHRPNPNATQGERRTRLTSSIVQSLRDADTCSVLRWKAEIGFAHAQDRCRTAGLDGADCFVDGGAAGRWGVALSCRDVGRWSLRCSYKG